MESPNSVQSISHADRESVHAAVKGQQQPTNDTAKGDIQDNTEAEDSTIPDFVFQDNIEESNPVGDNTNTQLSPGKHGGSPSPLVSPTRSAVAKPKLELPARWAGSVVVDISGMDPKAVKHASQTEVSLHSRVTYGVNSKAVDDAPEGLSLINIDIANLDTEITLGTPRSVQACLRLGVQPCELTRKQWDFFQKSVIEERAQAQSTQAKDGQEKVKSTTSLKLSETEKECCALKLKHHEERRKQKFYALVKERAIIAESTEAIAGAAPVKTHEESGLVAAEEKKLKKIVDANQAMLRQRLAHEHRMNLVKEDREKKIRQQKILYEQQREEHRKAELRKEREAELRQQLIKMRKSLEKREAEAVLRKKQAMHGMKDRQRREEQDRRKKELEEQNRARVEEAAERQQQIRTYNQHLQTEKRDQLLTRIERNEQNKLLHDDLRRKHLAERKARSLLKQAKIAAALERSQRVRDFKVERALEKEEKAKDALEMFHTTREKLLDEKRNLEQEKTVKRQRVYEESQRLLAERTSQIQARQLDQEHHFLELKKHRHEEGELRWHQRHMHHLDKLENVARMKKVTEYKKYLTVERIEDKMKKAEDMEIERENIKERRKRHREAIEAARVPIKRHTPGPGNYLGLDVPSTHNAPQWKFGVSANNQTMRVVAADKILGGVAPGYVRSPGPCAYTTHAALSAESTKKRNPCFTLSKADRFQTAVLIQPL